MRAQLGLAQMRDVMAAELDGAARRLEQPQHGARHRRLAAPALADQPQRLAFAHLEADPIDRIDVPDGAADDAPLDRKMFLEVGDLEHGAHANSRATNSACSLSPFGERVGVRGLPALLMDPNPLTSSF